MEEEEAGRSGWRRHRRGSPSSRAQPLGSVALPPSGDPVLRGALNAKQGPAGARRAWGGGGPRAGRPGRVSRERTQPRPAPPPPTPRSALPPAGPLRPTDPRAGPGLPGGLAAAGLRPGGAGGGQRGPAASLARRARRLCRLRGLQRCSPARGLEATRSQSAFSSRRCCTRGRDKKPGRPAWEKRGEESLGSRESTKHRLWGRPSGPAPLRVPRAEAPWPPRVA